jgi:dihydropteroate synthase
MDNVLTAPADQNTLFDAKHDLRFQVRQIESAFSAHELELIQFDEDWRPVAEKKYHHFVIKAHDLSAPAANILKQTCLTLGTDAGVHRGAINCTIEREAVLISATQNQLEKLIQKLRPQPFGLKHLSESLARMIRRNKTVSSHPIQTMAILNVTPDSFSDGGRFNTIEAVIQAAERALENGADILDIGGESTRPGAQTIDEAEELQRVVPVIAELHKSFPNAVMSIDTRKANVAKAALEAGASIINDVSGLTYDSEMITVLAESQCKVVIMHSQGSPETMQDNPIYVDVVGEVSRFFYEQITKAVEAGVDPGRIILDPGFGFGKATRHSLELMRRLPELASIGFPILAGTSRKSFLTLGKNDTPVNEREALTAASLTLAIEGGARILRVHDTHTQVPVINWLKAIYQSEPQ